MTESSNTNDQKKSKGAESVKATSVDPTEIDRYERLQRAGERQIENIRRDYQWHSALIGMFVLILTAIGGFFFYTNTTGFTNKMHDMVQSDMDIMTNRTARQIISWNEEITNQVNRQFEEPRIKQIVESVAINNASNIFSTMLIPEIQRFRTNLETEQKSFQKEWAAKLDQMEQNVANVRNDILSGFKTETIEGMDTNRFYAWNATNGTEQLAFVLSNAPLDGSIHIIMTKDGAQQSLVSIHNHENIVQVMCEPIPQGFIGWQRATYEISYTKDPRATNLWGHGVVKDNRFLVSPLP